MKIKYPLIKVGSLRNDVSIMGDVLKMATVI